MDKFDKTKRSEIMSLIRSKDTKAEKLIFSDLRKRGVYFQKHYKRALGNPDIALPRQKKAIFIDGDFWHGYRFKELKMRLPKVYWVGKIEKNLVRDRKYRRELRKKGWRVLRVWEHEVLDGLDDTVKKITDFIKE